MSTVLVDFAVGDFVRGKSIDYMNKIGQIVEVIIIGRVIKFDVLWQNKEQSIVLMKEVWKVENYELNPIEDMEDYDSGSSDESDVEDVSSAVSGQRVNVPEVAEREEIAVLSR